MQVASNDTSIDTAHVAAALVLLALGALFVLNRATANINFSAGASVGK